MAKKQTGKKKTATDQSVSKKPTTKRAAPQKSVANKKVSKKSAALKEPPEEVIALHRPGFPIVGLGASAGGLEALQEFFDAMPDDSGMAFVVVTHQHPGHHSMLAELLDRHTQMPCVEAADATQVEPNHIYVGPPGSNLAMLNGTLHLMDVENRRTRTSAGSTPPQLPIDGFFRSLAEDQGERAVCIILSGTGTDGTLGLQAVKAASGMTMVQDPASAKYDGMPYSAVATGLADYVTSPKEMPRHLVAYAGAPFLATANSAVEIPIGSLHKIFLLLRTRTGHDFSSYKLTTIRRRIERRMSVNRIQGPAAYTKYLQSNAHEIDILFKELLISVTSFFRDADAWAELAKTALAPLIESRPDPSSFRAWIPACATGEEAYTLAILLRETADQVGRHFDYQIFGTDLDAAAIETARAAVYPEGVAVDLTGPRLERYFSREKSTYRVGKEIREMCVFAPQNVIKDPPFTKLDLICCRNLLIYLDADMQQRLLPIFHYALKPGGLLMLGPSETIGQRRDLFEPVDTKWKVFARKELPGGAQLPDLPAQRVPSHAQPAPGATASQAAAVLATGRESQIGTLVSRLLLSRFAPSSIVVNERGDILYIHGRTGLYLEPSSGQPKMNVIEMAREGLEIELSTCLRQAAAADADVKHENVRIRPNGGYMFVDIDVTRIVDPESIRGLFLITLQPAAHPPVEPDASPKAERRKTGKGKLDPVARLERELQYTRESLQTTVEELETSNEELKSTNEELQSTNEELQSSNEELETSKEEMQSLNEELNTVNNQMQGKLDELSHANDDLHNLLNSSEIATIFLDMELRVKRFTESARQVVKIIAADVGRDVGDLKTKLDYDALEADSREVLRTLVPKESEVKSPEGQTFSLRIIPYRTLENVIDGVVVTFVDTTLLNEALALSESVVETVREPLVVLDEVLRVVQCNRAFLKTFDLREGQVVGELIYDASGGAWDNPDLRKLLEEVLPEKTTIENFEFTHTFPRVGTLRLLLNARRLNRASGLKAMILLAAEIVTEGS